MSTNNKVHAIGAPSNFGSWRLSACRTFVVDGQYKVLSSPDEASVTCKACLNALAKKRASA